MSITSNLIQNKIPFNFNGYEIIVDVKYADTLTDNQIPYNDNKKIQNPGVILERKITLDYLMNTIKTFLSQAKMFTMFISSKDKHLKPDKCKTLIEVNYNDNTGWFFNPYKNCTLHLYTNKLELKYDEDITTIYFDESMENINNNLPYYINGLIMLIVAGNYFNNIVTNGFLNFYFTCKKGKCEINIRAWDEIYFELNGTHYKSFTSLKYAIEEYEEINK
jgi:hypothetical protein